MKLKGALAIISVLSVVSGFFLARCARPGSPTGGPEDADPPVFLSAVPPNRTIHFNATKVTLVFNEFVQLKDASKEIFISPPMRIKPEFKTMGKKVIVEFQEELKENSTYTINFGNAIIDYTANNPLVNFEYVFSTGSLIDSLSIPGIILNAFNLEPVPDIIAMVYTDDNDTIPLDSLPLRVPPKSASKTTKDGNFRINNLGGGKYKLFGLQDLNNNYIYDLPAEQIAFLDSLVTIEPPEEIITPADSTDTAYVAPPALQISSEDSYTLYLFTETDTIQRLLSKKLFSSNLLQYIFRLPADPVEILPISFQPSRPDWYMTEFGNLKDTVNFWLKPGLPDTIRVCLQVGDSISDTSRFILSSTDKPGKRKQVEKGGLKIRSNVMAGALDLNKKLTLAFSVPIQYFDSTRLILYAPNDTITPSFAFQDTLQRLGTVQFDWQADEIYHLLIVDSAFVDLGGSYNDSLFINFRVRTQESYGLLIMDVTVPDTSGQYIIQLMTDKEFLLREKIITATGPVTFEYLMPGTYKLKAIFDANSNGKWDTGNYGKKELPEHVEYYPPGVKIRANWDLQEEWQLKSN